MAVSALVISEAESATVTAAIAPLRLDTCNTFEDLVGRVAAAAGKEITIHASGDERWGPLTGFVAHSDSRFTVLVRHTDLAIYQSHSVLHEFGHILIGIPLGLELACDRDFDTPDERAAETIAMTLGKRINLPSPYGELLAFA